MFRALLAIVVSFLAGHILTQHIADKKTIALTRSHEQSEYDLHTQSFGAGWDAGLEHGRREAKLRSYGAPTEN